MTKKQWQSELLRHLRPLSPRERRRTLAYYDELYDDQLESGLTEAQILENFGSPAECAARILSESGAEVTDSSAPRPSEQPRGSATVAEIIGLVFLTLILILPLACAVLTVILSFGIVSLAGAIVVIAGIASIIIVPFAAAGLGAAGIVALIGICIAVCGVGALLFVVFWLLTKYTALGTFKALQFIYMRRWKA
ncbi:MAG: DUF1700 domain-containing protein [Clostridia bacterium]|nr:DUF1700 domain-containing protein [Clostridia bacterium]